MDIKQSVFSGLTTAAFEYQLRLSEAEAEKERAELALLEALHEETRPYGLAILAGLGLDVSNAVRTKYGGYAIMETFEAAGEICILSVSAHWIPHQPYYYRGEIDITAEGPDALNIAGSGPQHKIFLSAVSQNFSYQSLPEINHKRDYRPAMDVPETLADLQADSAARPEMWEMLRIAVGLRIASVKEIAANWIIEDRKENAPAPAPAPAEETPPVPSSTVEAVSLMRALHGVIDRRLSWHDLIDG